MPLQKLQVAPGIDKQNTEYGAEGKWVDSDNVRFRYGQPEKIGGWEKVSSDALLAQHALSLHGPAMPALTTLCTELIRNSMLILKEVMQI